MKFHDKGKIDRQHLWIFGYGSLIWRPDFPYHSRRTGFIYGWARRFYQGSTDHRGIPEAPGRVVTLMPAADAVTWGAAYQVQPDAVDAVLAKLDHREKGGYARYQVDFFAEDARDRENPTLQDVLVYLATPDNPHFLGPAQLDEMAAQIATSHGPSGPNREYLLQLAQALKDMQAPDEHVETLYQALSAWEARQASGPACDEHQE